MTTAPELMTLYWTDAGIFPLTAEISPRDFEDRVKAAAKAGFVGIGVWHTDLEHILINRTLGEMKTILDDNGIKHVEVEFLGDWFVDGGRRVESNIRKQKLFEASAAIGAHHIKVGDFYSTFTPLPRLVDEFGALCREAEAFGATIGFEFMGSAMLPKLGDALPLVLGAAPRNGGLIVDISHVVSQGTSIEAVRTIPRQHMISVELNDGALPGSPLHDPARARRFCGEGDFDIKGFIAAVRSTGYDGPWAVEVFSKELIQVPLDEINRRAFETTMRMFA